MSGNEDCRLRECRNCGGTLDDVEWMFDPCPDSKDGSGHHEEAP